MKQFNENWDGVTRKTNLNEVKSKDGLHVNPQGSLVITNGNYKIFWLTTVAAAEVALKMVLEWGKKYKIDFTKGGDAVVKQLTDLPGAGRDAFKELQDIKTKAHFEIQRRKAEKAAKKANP